MASSKIAQLYSEPYMNMMMRPTSTPCSFELENNSFKSIRIPRPKSCTIQLSDFNVQSSVRNQLENYYRKAPPSDRVKCLDLLHRLESRNQNNSRLSNSRRPKTAMASINLKPDQETYGPYVSAYKRQFRPKPPVDTIARRPPSTNDAYTLPAKYKGATGVTHYEDEYWEKENDHQQPIRTGSSSGNRNNNPHPGETFLMWKFPRRMQFESQNGNPTTLTDEEFDKAMRGKLKSTYQVDYIGLPQGYNIKSAFDRDQFKDPRDEAKYQLDTTSRKTYTGTRLNDVCLNQPITRYGSNGNKQKASVGVIPNVPSHYLNFNGRTTFDGSYDDRQFIDKRPAEERDTLTAILADIHLQKPSTDNNNCRSAGSSRQLPSPPSCNSRASTAESNISCQSPLERAIDY